MRRTNILIKLIITVVWCLVACGQVLDDTTLYIEVVAGKNAVLPCQVQDIGIYQVVFSKSLNILTIGRNRRTEDTRFSIHTPYEHDWNLHVRGVKRSDAGEYSCAIHTNPIQKKIIHVTVQVSSEIIDHESSRNMNILEGSNITLVCKASGLPEPKYLWHYKRHGETGDGEHIINGARGELDIYDISRDQSGVYQCTAFNGIPPEDKKNIKVEVEFSPEVSVLNKEQSQFLGRNTELHCKISGFPLGKTVWLKDSEELPWDSWKYKQFLVSTNDLISHTLRLQVRNLDRQDFGEYVCLASNRYGIHSMSMELKDKAKRTTTTSTTTSTTTEPLTTTTTVPSSTTPYIVSSENGIVVDTNSSSKEPGYTILPTLKPNIPESIETDSGSRLFNVTTVYVFVALTCKLLTFVI